MGIYNRKKDLKQVLPLTAKRIKSIVVLKEKKENYAECKCFLISDETESWSNNINIRN